MSKTKVLKNGERIKSLFVSFAFFQKYMQAYNAQQYTCLDPLLIFWRSSRGNFIKLIRRQTGNGYFKHNADKTKI